MFGFANFLQQKNLGQWGEEYIASLYQRKGYKILDKNYFNRFGKRLGEIDIVAVKEKELVFVEVKTRTSESFGSGFEAIVGWKEQRLVRACKLFLKNNPEFADYQYRIDVAELKTDLDRNQRTVKIIENAIEDSQ